MDFSQHKIKRYNKANQKSGLQISLSYTGASLEDLLKFSALYNGLSGASVYGEIRPAAPKYFWEGYRNEAWTGTSQREGILSLYLKVAQRELNH